MQLIAKVWPNLHAGTRHVAVDRQEWLNLHIGAEVIAVDRQEWPNLHVGQPRESFSLVLGRLGRVQREPRGAPCAWAQSCVFTHDGFPPSPAEELASRHGCAAWRREWLPRAQCLSSQGCRHSTARHSVGLLSTLLRLRPTPAALLAAALFGWRRLASLPAPFALSRRPAGAAGRAEGGSMPS